MGGSLHIFSVGDIPVRVSIWYGLLLLLYFRAEDLRSSLLFVLVMTVSILVHELGHALVARRYRLHPQIVLHGLGGLCAHERAERDLHDVWILAAGPGAGLLLGAVTALAAYLARDWVLLPENAGVVELIFFSLYINVGWSLVNLLPIWPLDGGQLFRLLMLRVANPRLAERITHAVALTLLATALAIVGGFDSILTLLALWIGWANVQQLMSGAPSGPIRLVNKQSKQMLAEAERAFEKQDFAQAVRLGQQVRNEKNVPDAVLERTWTILGVSAARLGDHEDALAFLQHAKTSPEVVEAKIECLYALGRDEELDALLASKDFERIGSQRREEILEVVRRRE